MDESIPEPQTDGALQPPPRVPPTALATQDADWPRGRPVPFIARRRDANALLNIALDQLDLIADRIAVAAGLR